MNPQNKCENCGQYCFQDLMECFECSEARMFDESEERLSKVRGVGEDETTD